MRITEPRQLYETNQVVPTRQLLTLAQKWGFEVKPYDNGGSHIHCVSTKYSDITFGIIATTNRLSSQRNLADAFAEVQQRDAQKAKQKQTSKELSLQARLDNIRLRLPAYITAETSENGHVVLRDMHVPQIGITLYSAEEDRLLENKIHNILEPAKRSLFIELNRLKMKFDAVPEFDDRGVFTGNITHAVYGADIAEHIPAYEEGDTNLEPFEAVRRLIDRIEEKDLEQAIRKEELLAKPFLGAVLVSFSSQRGERHNRVSVLAPEARDLRLTFTTFSNQRVAGDGSRGRISDQELGVMAWKIGNIEKRIAKAAARAQAHLAVA